MNPNDEKQVVELSEKLIVGTAILENSSEQRSAVSLYQLTEMAKGSSSVDICAKGAEGIHICVAQLKSLGLGKYGKELLEKIGKKLDMCVKGWEVLTKVYSSNSVIDITEDQEKIEKAFEKICYILVKAADRYKLDISTKKEEIIKKQRDIDTDDLIKTLKAADAAFEFIGGKGGLIEKAIVNVETQQDYMGKEYMTTSGKIYNTFSRVLKGLWTYKYTLYFTGLSIYNIYNVVYLPGDMGLTMNTFFRILTAMCFTFMNDIVKLNQMRRVLIDFFGDLLLKVCGFFLGLFVINMEFPRVKSTFSFFIHLMFIGFTNWIHIISLSVCNMFGTSYALYETGGLSVAFWESVNNLGAVFTRAAVSTWEFLEGVLEAFGDKIMNMLNLLSNTGNWFYTIWETFTEKTGALFGNLFSFDIDLSKVGGEVAIFNNLKNSTSELAFTTPSGELVVIDEEFRGNIIGIVDRVVKVFQETNISPKELGKNVANIGSMILKNETVKFKNPQEQQFALRMMKIATVESLKNVAKGTLQDQAKTSYEKVESVIEKSLELTKMKPIIEWGTSQGSFKDITIQLFLFLSCFAYLFSIFFDKKNSPFWGYFLDMFE